MENIEYCEWIEYDYRTLVPVNHENYWRIPTRKGVLNYCPFCGKPVKVDGKPINEYLNEYLKEITNER